MRYVVPSISEEGYEFVDDPHEVVAMADRIVILDDLEPFEGVILVKTIEIEDAERLIETAKEAGIPIVSGDRPRRGDLALVFRQCGKRQIAMMAWYVSATAVEELNSADRQRNEGSSRTCRF